MEIYQSSKTAAEMEYALSAIPSIGANNHWFIGDQDTGVLAEGLSPHVGANGNWWVGETDTGIFAGGVKVEGAQVGQTIVIKAVDENGIPTEWEAVDAESYELISCGTLSEDGTILLSKDNDGNPFELRKVIFILKGSFNATQFCACSYTDINNHGGDIDVAVNSTVTGMMFFASVGQPICLKLLKTDSWGTMTLVSDHWGADLQSGDSNHLVYGGWKYLLVQDNIKQIRCGPNMGSAIPTAGSYYALYGVRA